MECGSSGGLSCVFRQRRNVVGVRQQRLAWVGSLHLCCRRDQLDQLSLRFARWLVVLLGRVGGCRRCRRCLLPRKAEEWAPKEAEMSPKGTGQADCESPRRQCEKAAKAHLWHLCPS